MDFIGIVETLGIPVAFALASFYATVFLIKWITGSLESLILSRFDEVRLIVIKLIDKQKEMEIKLSEWSSNTDTLVKFIIDLQTAKDAREEKRILKEYKRKNGN